MTNDSSLFSPIPEPTGAPLTPSEPPQKPAVALWRWWVFLFIIGSGPLLATLSSVQRDPNEPMKLPKSILGLLLFCAVQMAVFGVVWGIAWIFSRASKDDLLLRWKDGWKTIGLGVLYSIGMRLAILIVVIVVATVALTVLGILGYEPVAMIEAYKKSQPDMTKIFGPAFSQSDPLYRFLLITLVSFLVAGLREELWRTATMLGLQRVIPSHWSPTTRNVLVLGVSSILFGLGHWYQGLPGVLLTTVLGVVLGGIMLYHRSIWPAVMAHGFFNAASFLALSMITKK